MSLKQMTPLLAAIATAVCLCAVVGVFPAPAPSQPVMAPVAPDIQDVQQVQGTTGDAPQPPENWSAEQSTVETSPVDPVQPGSEGVPEPIQPQPAGTQDPIQPVPEPVQPGTEPVEPVAPITEPATEPVTEPKPVLPYDFTQPAPEGEAVEKTYFADAAFVGDSRTDGFMIYSGIGNGTNLTSNGLSIFRLESKKALKIGGEDYTLLEALALKEYGKVYLCLGVNELGIYNDEGFYRAYLSAIDAIRAAQPNAVIYIQGLIPLNEEERLATVGKSDLTNDHLRVYNDLMKRVAEEKQVVYLDLYSEFVDENGSLPAGASRDGVHLNKEYCQRWLAYLQTHTVDPAALGIGQTENEETEPK